MCSYGGKKKIGKRNYTKHLKDFYATSTEQRWWLQIDSPDIQESFVALLLVFLFKYIIYPVILYCFMTLNLLPVRLFHMLYYICLQYISVVHKKDKNFLLFYTK